MSDNDFNIEKFYGVYESKLLRVDAGDYYVTFGRGLALAMRKDGEDVLDNTLRGMKFELSAGNSIVKMLAGLSNTINIDPNHEGQQENPGDMIAGLRFEQRIADLFSLGAHGVYANFGALESDWTKRFIPEKQTEIFGGSIEFPDIGGVVSLYGEGNYLRRTGRQLTELGDDFEIVEDAMAMAFMPVSPAISRISPCMGNTNSIGISFSVGDARKSATTIFQRNAFRTIWSSLRTFITTTFRPSNGKISKSIGISSTIMDSGSGRTTTSRKPGRSPTPRSISR